MTEAELINSFKYNGLDICRYAGKIEVVSSDESKMIDGEKTVIATTSTFSCSNVLVYNEDFAYLVHMLPSETVGKNENFDRRITELEHIFISKQVSEANVVISLGQSIAKNKNMDFHNLDYLKEKLNQLISFCNENNITLNMLPVLKSKYLLFDLQNQLLIVNNNEKKAFDIKEIENLKTTLTQNNVIKK